MPGGNGVLLDHVVGHVTGLEAICTFVGAEIMQALIVGPRHHWPRRLI